MEGFSWVSSSQAQPCPGHFSPQSLGAGNNPAAAPFIVTGVDSVSRRPPPSGVTQKLGLKLGAVLGACDHSSLAWYVGYQRAFKTHLKRNKVLKLAQALECVHGVCILVIHTQSSLLTDFGRSVSGTSVKPR